MATNSRQSLPILACVQKTITPEDAVRMPVEDKTRHVADTPQHGEDPSTNRHFVEAVADTNILRRLGRFASAAQC